ncbi:SAM-dependent methyltransferase [Candidatus Phytoplasma pruni]|uniref:SAM-dependent methyltransferase n=1 Tax=Candidatus Phytoplasma pruni TaxID=479893 RepID=A0A851HIV2_9MOLU|nr:SAM-dependent methyltransferase [Candidatus Phytoplasma pruni]NWN45753.1 SAM-dependent methyltransferase [Candidatus Phytoplasma pruni]
MNQTNPFEIFTLLKNNLGINFLTNELKVHKGTILRWERLQNIPHQYNLDLQKILHKTSLQHKNQPNHQNNKFTHTRSGIDTINPQTSTPRTLDEFYTTPQTTLHCWNVLQEKLATLNINLQEYHYIEPSAGSGSFYNLLPSSRRTGVEINPSLNPEYIVSDFLDYQPPHKEKNIVIGNPPFGLRGNMALRFINHASQFTDIVAFILPPFFASDGKGTPAKRVQQYQLIHSEKLPPDSFQYPDGKTVKVSTVFQIWSKITPTNKTHHAPASPKTAHQFIKIYSLSAGKTPGTTRNKKMIDKCDIYLPNTCFRGMKTYDSFQELPNKRGYGIKILQNKTTIKKILQTANWEKIAFISTNGALNLRMSLINEVIIQAGYHDSP